MPQVNTPDRPSSVTDILTFTINVINLTDPTTDIDIYVPTITMHVNPIEMDLTYKKLIHRYRTRGGWIEEHWGEELDKMAVTGSTGSFLHSQYGLNVSNRYETLAMVNFQEVLAVYRNNACFYDDSGNIIAQGDILIEFDNFKYIGQFANFNWDEDADNPYRFTFNFNYEVRQTVGGV